MLHAMLPTHARANKLDGGSGPCVPCCSNHKGHHNILCCKYHSRDTCWRQGLLRDLRDFFISSNTLPLLSNLPFNSIRQWFLSPSDVFIQTEQYHALLHPIIRQQIKLDGDSCSCVVCYCMESYTGSVL
jgi:hypothetical protein